MSSTAATAQTTKPKAVPTHPPVATMVNDAITALKDRKGTSLIAIKKHIAANNTVDMDRLAGFIKRYLKSAVEAGKLVQTKGTGATGSFKMGKVEKPKKEAKKPTDKKEKVEKKPADKKEKVEKKPVAKKDKVAKKPAATKDKVAKKPAATKEKAAKKPVAKKSSTKTAAKKTDAKKTKSFEKTTSKKPATKKPKTPKKVTKPAAAKAVKK